MADEGGDNNAFVYMGGDQEVPEDVTHVRVHKSVKIITRYAFQDCENLVSVEMHDGVEIIEEVAFYGCSSLRGIKLPGVRVIKHLAFAALDSCLEDVEFGNKLESIGDDAFRGCRLRNIKLPKCRVIGKYAFANCEQLTEVELFDEDLETIKVAAFFECPRLRRIAIPLKDEGDFLEFPEWPEIPNVFQDCEALEKVNLVGGVHKTISSLFLKSWRDEMNNEIVFKDLYKTNSIEKTAEIRHWLKTVSLRIKHYKSKHYALLKENTTLLELALWKVKLQEKGKRRFHITVHY